MTSWIQYIDEHVPVLLDIFAGRRQCRLPAIFGTTQALIRRHSHALRSISKNAEATKRTPELTEIQKMLTTLPPIIASPINVLVVMAVGHNDLDNLKSWLGTTGYDFFVYSYVCKSEEDLQPLRDALSMYANLRMLHHKVKTGCKLAFWHHALQTVRAEYLPLYTHIWFVDSDLDLLSLRLRGLRGPDQAQRTAHMPAWYPPTK